MKNQDTAEGAASDVVTIEDKNGRRRFIRSGAAFLLAGSAVAGTTASAQEEDDLFLADCDSVGYNGEKNAEAEGSDSDSGNNADRPGCGRKKPVITEYRKGDPKKVKVGKVIV